MRFYTVIIIIISSLVIQKTTAIQWS